MRLFGLVTFLHFLQEFSVIMRSEIWCLCRQLLEICSLDKFGLVLASSVDGRGCCRLGGAAPCHEVGDSEGRAEGGHGQL